MSAAEPVDFALLFEALVAPHLALAPDATILAANAGLCRLLRRPAAELLGQPALPVLRQQAVEAPYAEWEQALAEVVTQRRPRTLRLLHQPGPAAPARHWQVQLRPVADAAGTLRYVLCRVLDVTEQVLTAEQGQFSREGFGLLAQATHEAIWDADPRTGEVWRNARYATLFGYPPDATADSPRFWHERVHPADLPAVEAEQRRAMASQEEVVDVEYRFRRADGAWADVVDRAYIVRDAAGQPVRLLGAMQDVTRQRAAETLARQSAARFRHLTEVQQQLVWTARADGELEYVNPYWEQYLGLSLEQSRAGGTRAVFHPDDVEAVQQLRQQSLATGAPFETELRLRHHATGAYRWFLARTVPVPDESGAIGQWVGTALDVHERRLALAQLQEKDRRLQNIIGNVPAFIITMSGPDLLISYVNEQLSRLLAGRPQVGRPVAEALPELVDDGLIEILRQVYASGQGYSDLEVESPVIRGPGIPVEYRYYDFTYQPFYNTEGQTAEIMMFAVDATERVRARQRAEQLAAEVRHHDEQFRFLAESIPQIVWTADPAGQIEYINERWSDYTGQSKQNLMQADWSELVAPADMPALAHRYLSSMASGQDFEQEARLRDHTGHYRWFLHRARPMRDAAGRILKWFGSSTDIDDFKQAQQRLEQQNEDLTLTNQDLDNFVYTASHDLKQPIHNMAGIFAELTRTAFFRDPEAVKLIAMFERSLQQILDTIHNLSELVQVQKLRQHLPVEPVALEPLAREVLSSISEQLQAARAQVVTDFAAAPVVPFVRPNLQSVLYNLISNALKYAAPDRRPRIGVRSYQQDGQCVLEVQDNGLGIDLERYGPQLFSMFRRFHTHVEGSGMGLYLVNRIVQSQGGRVEVQSVVDEGTTFRIYFSSPPPPLPPTSSSAEPLVYSI